MTVIIKLNFVFVSMFSQEMFYIVSELFSLQFGMVNSDWSKVYPSDAARLVKDVNKILFSCFQIIKKI